MAGTEDEQVSDSGGSMVRLVGEPSAAHPDPTCLEALRAGVGAHAVRPSGAAPYFTPGQVLTWHWGRTVDVVRVVRDDERGLVAWLPADAERLGGVPRDGRALRDRSLEERVALSLGGDYDLAVSSWTGTGVLRIAPTGAPWSLWYFTEDDDSFAGCYVNLELPHVRPADESPRVHSGDLTLDLWLDAEGELWLKDADELAVAAEHGYYSPQQAETIREIAEQVRHDLIAPRAWPLDEGWETWRPTADLDAPLALPDLFDLELR